NRSRYPLNSSFCSIGVPGCHGGKTCEIAIGFLTLGSSGPAISAFGAGAGVAAGPRDPPVADGRAASRAGAVVTGLAGPAGALVAGAGAGTAILLRSRKPDASVPRSFNPGS